MSALPSRGSDAVDAELPAVEVVSGHPTDDELLALRLALAQRARVVAEEEANHARRASAVRGASRRYRAPNGWAPATRSWP